MNLNRQLSKLLIKNKKNYHQLPKKTIETLQNLIEDKDEQIQKRERLVEKMKKDFLVEKEKDAQEIKQLNSQISELNMNFVGKMQNSTVINNGQVLDNTQYWGDVGQLLSDKDKKIDEYAQKLKEEITQHKYTKNSHRDLQDQVDTLKAELNLEQKKNQTGPLVQQIETLKKLVQQKDKDLKQLKTTFDIIKKESLSSQLTKDNQASEHKVQIEKASSEKNKMESQMLQALNNVAKLKSEVKQYQEELEKLRQQDIQTQNEKKELQTQLSKFRQEPEKQIVQEKDKSVVKQLTGQSQIQAKEEQKEPTAKYTQLQEENESLKLSLIHI
eukprot:TRINITY_DN27302_c0_g1_i2.p1 TRINITY_DN27302_c0_g1~~TRINITY_DN27302_c0_g1_i2.p1  ORF type:complete len:328 (-),score=88.28 TRINITY_DN27302_c0_g1_i2:187-1170(-)